jgi:anti-sigma-K factor RskA
MSNLWSWFQANWRTNLIATAAIVYSAREFTLAITAWVNHQPENWRAAIISLFVAQSAMLPKMQRTLNAIASR